MDLQTKIHIQRSFDKIEPVAQTFASLFYVRLFETAPRLRPMFPTDLRQQQRKLMDMLTFLVEALDVPEAFEQELLQLGSRHKVYGVTAEHSALVNQALLWTLQRTLQDDFTPEIATAWTTLLNVISTTMNACFHNGH